MSVPSFFGSLFSELIPGGDCSSIEQDPHADPFDKEVCQQFGRFNRAFSGFNVEVHSPDEENAKEKQSDPQSLRDSILNRPGEEGAERPHRRPRFHRPRQPRVDEDLDESVKRDPRLLDEYLNEESPRRESRTPHFHSSYSSVVITTRPDGSYEEKRTVRDADGNEEVTVTYSDAGKTHSEKLKTRHPGLLKEDSDKPSRIWGWLGFK